MCWCFHWFANVFSGGIFPRFIPWEKTVWYKSFLHWICSSVLLKQLNAQINSWMPFSDKRICVMHNTNVMQVFWCELICSICRCPRLPFCDCWHFNVTLCFGTVNCEYQYYRMWAFCWCFQWVAKGIWFMHFRVFFSVRKKLFDAGNFYIGFAFQPLSTTVTIIWMLYALFG